MAKNRPKKYRALIISFFLGVAFVIACGDGTNTAGAALDRISGLIDAINVLFDNSETDIAAENAQDALVELDEEANERQSQIHTMNAQLGSALEILSATTKCNANQTLVHSRLCIDNSRSPSATVKDAITACREEGAVLCSFEQFVAACEKQRAGDLPSVDALITTTWKWTRTVTDATSTGNFLASMGGSNVGCQVMEADFAVNSKTYFCCKEIDAL